MDCHSVLEEVNNYLDRQVEVSAAEQIELHLSCCRNCRIVYDTVARTVRLYCEDRQQVSDAVRQRIRQALKAAAEEALPGALEVRSEPGFSILRTHKDATVPPEQAVAIYSEARHLPPELHDSIARRAYEIFLERGGAPGHELEDWVRAEAEILNQGEATSEETASS
jgi:hypothetical protein